MKTILIKLSIIVLTTGCFIAVKAQQPIKGSVYEIDGSNKKVALPFANVYWEGTSSGTVADESGGFKLDHHDGQTNLIASFVGYSNDTIVYSGQPRIDFILLKGTQLTTVEVKDKLEGSYISKLKPIKTEVITTEGLQKLACCNLSESFENNATVDVGFSDAVTGARQIQMLGLAGVYSQMMVENIPFTRGLGSAFGLTYVPGTWMESIQISKGASSVVNGYESITGQINTEFRKPWNSDKFFFNAYANNEGRYEVNAHASAKISEKLSTLVLAHNSQQVMKSDMNHDGFIDMPLSSQINLSNRWSYEKHGVTESKFGINFLQDKRTGGQLVDRKTDEAIADGQYVMEVLTRRAQVYDKTGFMFRNMPNTSLGLIFSGLYHEQQSMFGRTEYDARQLGFYGNAIFQTGSPVHGINTGISWMYDDYDEVYADSSFSRIESVPGVFAQYTFTPNEKMSFIAGIRADQHNVYGLMVTPRAHFKVNVFENTVLRGSAGKGFRSPSILAENTGLLVSSRQLVFREDFKAEEAWNYGLNITQDIKLDDKRKMTIAMDFYHTDFINQVIVDLDEAFNKVVFYNLDGKSYANSFQTDITASLFQGFESLLPTG
jgi:outer membrane receptor for ferrienterochelin and colicins